jgi:hypothetical protein
MPSKTFAKVAKKTPKTAAKAAARKTATPRAAIDIVEPLATWLAPAYRTPAALTKHARAYRGAKPYPHAVLPGIFAPAKAKALRTAILALQKRGGFTHKESDLFSLAQTPDFRGETAGPIGELVAFFRSSAWNDYLEALTGERLSRTELDIGGSLYTDTDYLLCHDDRVTGRRIAFIYYLCEDFGVTDGGALVLLDTLGTKGKQPGKVVKRYPPRFNTLALFTVSERSWHAVEEVTGKRNRFSINGWFH